MTNIESLEYHHWENVRTIYEEGTRTGYATFKSSVPLWEVWDLAHLKFPSLVIIYDGILSGWGALSPV